MGSLPNARFLPVTIGVIAGLLGVKAIALTKTALAGETSASADVREPAFIDKGPVVVAPPSKPHPIAQVDRTSCSGSGNAVSDAALIGDLEKERADLDRRRSALEAQEAATQASSEALDRRMTSLQALEHKLADAAKAHEVQDNVAWVGLVKVYEAMRPDDAATIFNGLELHTLLELLGRMNDRKAALVLGAMQPERARVATQMLAEQRLHGSNVPALSGSSD